MIIKNEIPLLEYDDSSSEVIAPDHDWTAERLRRSVYLLFLEMLFINTPKRIMPLW